MKRVDIWCPIHSHVKVDSGEPQSCSFCADGLKWKLRALRLQEALTTPGQCGFCGGPTPCLREA